MKKALLFAPMSSVHERFNIANINALKELGAVVHLLANFSSDEHSRDYKKKCTDEKLIVHDMPFSRHSLKSNFQYIKQIKELLKSQNFDIVHAHTETGGILLRLAMSANKNTKYFYTAHGMSFYKGSSLKSQIIYKPIERFICKKMDANLAINQEEFFYLKKWKPNAAHFVHGAGFDMEAITSAKVDIEKKKTELGIPLDRKLILSVGELNENKNHIIILKAIAGMKEEERPYLLICGEGEKRNELLSYAKSFSFEEKLFLPGYRYDMSEIFHIADLFVFPSYHEGLSFSLMQAMAAGLPVICSNIRGNVDLIQENEGGFLVQPQDNGTIRLYIEKLLNDKSLCNEFSKKNKKKVQLYSDIEVTKELEKLYLTIK